MHGEREQLDYAQLIEALRRHCRERRTGTMFICTDDNQAARFVLEQGRVIGCAYRRKHGREALNLIQEIKGGRFSFSEGMFMVEEVPMPDTAVLFQLLDKQRTPEEVIELDALHREPQAPDVPPAALDTAPPIVAVAEPEAGPEVDSRFPSGPTGGRAQGGAIPDSRRRGAAGIAGEPSRPPPRSHRPPHRQPVRRSGGRDSERRTTARLRGPGAGRDSRRGPIPGVSSGLAGGVAVAGAPLGPYSFIRLKMNSGMWRMISMIQRQNQGV
jgi:hypothetical protein